MVWGLWVEKKNGSSYYWVVVRIYSHIASLILIVYSIHDCTCRRSSTGDILSDLIRSGDIDSWWQWNWLICPSDNFAASYSLVPLRPGSRPTCAPPAHTNQLKSHMFQFRPFHNMYPYSRQCTSNTLTLLIAFLLTDVIKWLKCVLVSVRIFYQASYDNCCSDHCPFQWLGRFLNFPYRSTNRWWWRRQAREQMKMPK